MYLDDWLVSAPSEGDAARMMRRAIAVTERMGFVINKEKSLFTPTQRINWLGMLWDSHSATFRVSDQNAAKIHRRLVQASLSLSP